MDAMKKLKQYDKLIEKGLDKEELKKIRNKIYRVDTYFDTKAAILKLEMLECIKDFLRDWKERKIKDE